MSPGCEDSGDSEGGSEGGGRSQDVSGGRQQRPGTQTIRRVALKGWGEAGVYAGVATKTRDSEHQR